MKTSPRMRKEAFLGLGPIASYAIGDAIAEIGGGLLGGSGAWHYMFGPKVDKYRQLGQQGESFQNWTPALAGAGVGALGGMALRGLTNSKSVLYPLAFALGGGYLGKRYGNQLRRFGRRIFGSKKAASSGIKKDAGWGWVVDPLVGLLSYYGASAGMSKAKRSLMGPSREEMEGGRAALTDMASRGARARLGLAKWPALAGLAGGLGYNWLSGSRGWTAPLLGGLALGTAGYFTPEIIGSLRGRKKMAAIAEEAEMSDAERRAHNVQRFLHRQKAAMSKSAYIKKQKGTNAEGEKTDYVIKSHEDGDVLGHYKTRGDAEAALRAMKANS